MLAERKCLRPNPGGDHEEFGKRRMSPHSRGSGDFVAELDKRAKIPSCTRGYPWAAAVNPPGTVAQPWGKAGPSLAPPAQQAASSRLLEATKETWAPGFGTEQSLLPLLIRDFGHPGDRRMPASLTPSPMVYLEAHIPRTARITC